MALPNHRVEIVKAIGTEEWANDYLVDVPDLDAAIAFANTLVVAERAFHYNNVVFVRIRASTLLVGDRRFRVVGLTGTGSRTATATVQLPLFNVARVDIQTQDSDPLRKYYRLPLQEEEVTNASVEGATRTLIDNQLNLALGNANVAGRWVSGSGNVALNAVTQLRVAQRQLKRRRKKKETTAQLMARAVRIAGENPAWIPSLVAQLERQADSDGGTDEWAADLDPLFE